MKSHIFIINSLKCNISRNLNPSFHECRVSEGLKSIKEETVTK